MVKIELIFELIFNIMSYFKKLILNVLTILTYNSYIYLIYLIYLTFL